MYSGGLAIVFIQKQVTRDTGYLAHRPDIRVNVLRIRQIVAE